MVEIKGRDVHVPGEVTEGGEMDFDKWYRELAHLEYNYEQVGNETATAILEILVDKEGLCQMRPLINEEDT